ncbi:MAG TPA: hypothetical protein VMX94_06870 [Armatimonadota bacterium]|nr:hypothetical protein [Armatimonadota bacterium]
MAEDRLRRDYDSVENLGDLIEAREERDSAFADDVDAAEDIDDAKLPRDPVDELTRPHPRGRSEEEGSLGINVDLMSTPDEKDVGFDWQDSAEEMLPTDPESSEGMGADEAIESLAHTAPADLLAPAPPVEVSPETDTAATKAEEKEYELDNGEAERPAAGPVPIDSAMDTDSDEFDFTIEDKFEDQVDRETALYEFEQMRETAEKKPGEE